MITLTRPPTSSSLRITDRSFQYASPRLWNQLPASLRQPRTNHSDCDSFRPTSATSFSTVDSPLSPSITPSLFHSRLKTFLFHKYFHPRLPSLFQTDLVVSCPAPFLLSISIFVLSFFSFLLVLVFGSVRQIKLASVSFRAHIKIAISYHNIIRLH